MLAILKLLAELVAYVVQCIKGDKQPPRQLPDPEQAERVRQLEERLANDAKQRIRELDEKADRARDARDAAGVLRDVTGTDDPTLN